MPKDLEAWLAHNDYIDGASREPISGGCISQAWSITCRNGDKLFIKYRDDVPKDFYEAEALGISYLHELSNAETPQVLGYGEHFIAQRYIHSGQQRQDFWDLLARQLAHVHNLTRVEFGFVKSNYCGMTPQVNRFTEDGHQFFIENRILLLAERAYQNSLLESGDLHRLENLCIRLKDYIPDQPASLLHGDLWSGNVHVSEQGCPVLIDPAVYYGWAEIDLAMTDLFGGFPQRFYDAYEEIRPLESGWRQRLPIYNLYPLLNHLILFGEGYLSSVRSVLDRYD